MRVILGWALRYEVMRGHSWLGIRYEVMRVILGWELRYEVMRGHSWLGS